MLRSMTGFGRGEIVRYNRRFKVEMKSVNHRFSDFTIKAPRFLNPFEDRIRHRLSKDIFRGKVEVWINFESFTPNDITVHVNELYADAYMEALNKLSTRLNLGRAPGSISLDLLARVPDIIVFDKYESALNSGTAKEEIWEVLSEALDEAISRYNDMREKEGSALVKDIEDKHERACKLIADIRMRIPHNLEAGAAKIRERVNELTAKLGTKPDEGKLMTEIAFHMDKGDVNEELTRLESHFGQLKDMLREQVAVGRKIDFIVQEMNREANTIGSKSTDTQLTNMVVELKSVIEKIREQIQNIE